jgi:hypothetical protein
MKDMRKFTLEQLTEANLDYMPHIKHLLKIHIGYTYEDSADYSNESLKRELLYLVENDRIEELTTVEWVYRTENMYDLK